MWEALRVDSLCLWNDLIEVKLFSWLNNWDLTLDSCYIHIGHLKHLWKCLGCCFNYEGVNREFRVKVFQSFDRTINLTISTHVSVSLRFLCKLYSVTHFLVILIQSKVVPCLLKKVGLIKLSIWRSFYWLWFSFFLFNLFCFLGSCWLYRRNNCDRWSLLTFLYILRLNECKNVSFLDEVLWPRCFNLWWQYLVRFKIISCWWCYLEFGLLIVIFTSKFMSSHCRLWFYGCRYLDLWCIFLLLLCWCRSLGLSVLRNINTSDIFLFFDEESNKFTDLNSLGVFRNQYFC